MRCPLEMFRFCLTQQKEKVCMCFILVILVLLLSYAFCIAKNKIYLHQTEISSQDDRNPQSYQTFSKLDFDGE